MANTLPFKFYLLTNNGQDKEIRRLALEPDEVANLTYLVFRKKLLAVYSQLQYENYTLCYIGKHQTTLFCYVHCLFHASYSVVSIDEEGDKITISTDHELLSASQFMLFKLSKYGEPFRFFIHQKPKTNSTTSTTLTGKCFQCPDADLCGKCEAAGVHPEYRLIRVTGPMVLYLMPTFLN